MRQLRVGDLIAQRKAAEAKYAREMTALDTLQYLLTDEEVDRLEANIKGDLHRV